jgi:hypothetical protein
MLCTKHQNIRMSMFQPQLRTFILHSLNARCVAQEKEYTFLKKSTQSKKSLKSLKNYTVSLIVYKFCNISGGFTARLQAHKVKKVRFN